MRRLGWVLVAAAAMAACSKAGEEQRGKRAPIARPPPTSALPAGLDIPVDIDGVAAAPITSGRLAGLSPDFAENGRRAWRLTRLLGPALDRPGEVVEAVGPDGVAIAMPRPAGADGMEPVLFLTRRGEMVATLLDPRDPFPDFHGQGGRLRRRGDPTPRVAPVVRLRVRAGAP